MAKFIVIDGLDGCGKATQTELLRQELEKQGKRVVKIDFPKYDSDSSAAVRMYLGGQLGDNPEKLNPYMCGTFYAVDRYIQYVTDWYKYFEEDDNTIVIADRYLSANIIHQGGKIEDREKRLKYAYWCYNQECGYCGLPKEDITIVLTVKPEISQRLMTKRYNGNEDKKDIHEANIEYLEKCYDRLKWTVHDIMHTKLATWVRIDCADTSGDNIDTVENIHNKIMEQVEKIISGTEINIKDASALK